METGNYLFYMLNKKPIPVYADEPTFMTIVMVLIVISYFVGKYLDND